MSNQLKYVLIHEMSILFFTIFSFNMFIINKYIGYRCKHYKFFSAKFTHKIVHYPCNMVI